MPKIALTPSRNKTMKATKVLNEVLKASDDFKVKDITLADWGRKEIEIAQYEMPGLRSIRAKYAKQRPLKGVRITG